MPVPLLVSRRALVTGASRGIGTVLPPAEPPAWSHPELAAASLAAGHTPS